ncbi:MAG: EVE domain-containing protein [Chloroherpetonaceae bacterium]|nr:EVE domain-containing protein [Chloroherpetonaceae bacterium]MDW8436519.1 EVE domain-containing protein [Chloroherpetonaceae bacterium]
MHYLLKTEPSEYGIDQLQRETQCVWDGVENALALKHLRAIRKGDSCFIYHTGKEKRIVGLAEAVSDAYEKDGAWVFEVKFVQRYAQPLSLEQMKASQAFAGFDLLRLPRLSVMPVPDPIAKEILKRAK